MNSNPFLGKKEWELQTLENFPLFDKKKILRDIPYFLLIQMTHPESPVKKEVWKQKEKNRKKTNLFLLWYTDWTG